MIKVSNQLFDIKLKWATFFSDIRCLQQALGCSALLATALLPLLRVFRFNHYLRYRKQVLEDRRKDPAASLWQLCLKHLFCTVSGNLDDLPVLAPDEPLLLIANHPTPAEDGILLACIAQRLRPHFKILLSDRTALLLPWIDESMVVIRHMPTTIAQQEKIRRQENVRVRNAAIDKLCAGGTLAFFPAASTSQVASLCGPVTEGPWHRMLGKIVHTSQATLLPVRFEASYPMVNSIDRLLKIFGWQYSAVHDAFVMYDFSRYKHVKVIVGEPLRYSDMAAVGCAVELTDWLYRHVGMLQKHSVSAG